jgi:hypothetical protein
MADGSIATVLCQSLLYVGTHSNWCEAIASRMSWLGEAAFERGDPRRGAPLSVEVAKSRRAPRTPPCATGALQVRASTEGGGPVQTA